MVSCIQSWNDDGICRTLTTLDNTADFVPAVRTITGNISILQEMTEAGMIRVGDVFLPVAPAPVESISVQFLAELQKEKARLEARVLQLENAAQEAEAQEDLRFRARYGKFITDVSQASGFTGPQIRDTGETGIIAYLRALRAKAYPESVSAKATVGFQEQHEDADGL